MKQYKYIIGIAVVVLGMSGCKKDLDITNVNLPTPESAQNEAGILALAQGTIYQNGFFDLKYSDGVFGRFWAGAMGFQELMGDIVGAEAANAYMNQIGCPDKVILDNGTIVLNPNTIKTQYELCRYINNNAQGGSNTTFYEWAYMYNMITAANTILGLAEKTTFTGTGAATKKAAIQAWAYWWKAYAYGRIGSMYYAGIIQNAVNSEVSTNGNYVAKEAVITESNATYNKAATALAACTSVTDYNAIIGKLIPSFLQKGKGGILTTAMWLRNINTMKARNILVNTTKAAMTTTQWNSILTLVNDGITSTDLIFTGRTDANGSFMEASVADRTSQIAANSTTGTYKLSERWVQEFTSGDKRKDNNVLTLVSVGQFNTDRGNAFNTRFSLKNGGNGMPGVITYANTVAGANEITIAASYEENELMKAEALIQTGIISAGLLAIDRVRSYQGAGLPAISSSLTATQAYEELRKERRIALAFKGLAFYDARRWDIIAPNKSRTGCNLISSTGALNTNATIMYGYLDYWDVPDNELAYNPALPGSAPVKNPK